MNTADTIHHVIEGAGVLAAGMGAFFGVKTGVRVLEARVTALETLIATHVAALTKRIDDLIARGH